MIIRIIYILIFFSGFAVAGRAHPHLFVDAKLTFVFDEKGLAGIKEHWTFDEMFSAMILEDFDTNHDKQLNTEEIGSIKHKAFANLKNFEYFTFVRIDDKPFKAEYVKDFHAEMQAEKLIYQFFVPCHVTAIPQYKTMKVSIFDKSYFTAIQLTEDKSLLKGKADIFEINTKVHRVKEFICFEEDGFPETTILKFRCQP